LFYSDSIICFDGLIIPHPEIQNRNFVLTPLNEIAPDYIHPGLKKDVRTLLKNLNTDKQVKIYDKSIKTVILIDNYDSFTYNLYQQLESLGADTKVVAHDKISIKNINSLMPSKIVISPGPGKPEDSGISRDVIESFYKKVPILGVCLGHECIGEIFGAKVVHAKKILHGKTSEIRHNNSGIFKGLKNPFEAARYNSLVIDQTPEDFILTAWDPDNEIMGISHKRYPLHGIQFHPESFMTKYGHKLIRNFLNEN
jgi:anthranilate synthase/aminodeoxychorismate synthase-like glutamine amidotransferase